MDLLLIALFGLEFGSFANVCIYRWPRNQSIAKPVRSHCPWCGHQIAWWENIPLLSFFMLRRKCSHCRASISWRYPLVELSLPLLWIFLWKCIQVSRLEFSFPFLLASAFFAFALLVATMSDLDWRIIPDETSLSLVVVGFLVAPWNPFFVDHSVPMRFIAAAQGVLIGAFLLWAVGLFGKFIFGKEAMGGGDVKFLAGMGAFLGWQSVFSVLVLSSMAGSIVVLFALLFQQVKHRQYIPFGPFLSLAGLCEFVLKVAGASVFDKILNIP